jgi:excisionase family DNA binding protein
MYVAKGSLRLLDDIAVKIGTAQRHERGQPMPATKVKTGPVPTPAAPVEANHEVLTLAEAAAYLRVPEADLFALVSRQDYPGRQIGKEWRFLKSALQDWLRAPQLKSGKEALLAISGTHQDDPFLEEIVREAYRQRGRPMTEDGE